MFLYITEREVLTRKVDANEFIPNNLMSNLF